VASRHEVKRLGHEDLGSVGVRLTRGGETNSGLTLDEPSESAEDERAGEGSEHDGLLMIRSVSPLYRIAGAVSSPRDASSLQSGGIYVPPFLKANVEPRFICRVLVRITEVCGMGQKPHLSTLLCRFGIVSLKSTLGVVVDVAQEGYVGGHDSFLSGV
jgi:hypothetical protein